MIYEQNGTFREIKKNRFKKKKTNDLKLLERTWKNYRFLLNDRIFQKIWKKTLGFTEQTIYWNKLFLKRQFLTEKSIFPYLKKKI